MTLNSETYVCELELLSVKHTGYNFQFKHAFVGTLGFYLV